MSFWSAVPLGKPDAIFGLVEAYERDVRPDKINLAIGTFVDRNDKPYVLQIVRKAERLLVDEDKEYAGVLGYPAFRAAVTDMLLGMNSSFVKGGLVASAQTISGTGALRIAAMFIEKYYPKKEIYLSDPTWPNHPSIFSMAGLQCKSYRYFDQNTNLFDFQGAQEDFKAMPDGSVILMQACGHNPTGCDPSQDQWIALSRICKEKRHLVVFDVVYQGFSTGTLDGDVFGVRQMARDGNQIIMSYSFSKNLGLYGERTGCLLVLTASKEEVAAVESQLKIIIRPLWSNPPIHGARITTKILNNPQLCEEWQIELKKMADQVNEMRETFAVELKSAGSTKDWSFIKKQQGWFAYIGLTEAQVLQMQEERGIYVQKSGRIPIVKLNPTNVKQVAEAITQVTN